MKCDRCGRDVLAWRTSWFNTQTVCIGPGSCAEREVAHPAFKEAQAAEEAAVLRGDLNFAGIGLPEDLK